MTEQRQADACALETTDTARQIKRRGLIAGAAALAAGVLAATAQRSSVAAFSFAGTYSANANGYNGSQDSQLDGLQGYTKGANLAGVFGRNNDTNGLGVFGIGTNGIGVFGQSSNGPGISGHSESSIGTYGESEHGQGILGLAKETTPNASVTTTGVTGKSLTDAGTFGWNTWYTPTNGTLPGNAVGLYGLGNSGLGVSGKSSYSGGVLGVTYSSNTPAVTGASYLPGTSNGGTAPGVYGNSGSNYGVYGNSASSYGVIGTSASSHGVVGGSGSAGTAGIYGYPSVSGAYAGIFAGPVSITGAVNVTGGTQINVPVTGANNHGIVAYGQTSGYGGVYGVGNAAGSVGIYGDVISGAYAGYFHGALAVTGAKAAVVPHPDGSHRTLYCVESPEAWFEDFGEGTLAAGAATVTLDPDFAAVVDTSKLYIFLTPLYAGGNGLAVTQRSATGFTVAEGGQGKSSGGFAYRVVAKRKDIPSPRLAKVTLPTIAVAAAPPSPPAFRAIPTTPAVPTIPVVPHHGDEDAITSKPTGSLPVESQMVATDDSMLLRTTRL